MNQTLSQALEIEICIDGKTFSWVVRNKLLACFMQDFWVLLINMKQWSFSNSFTGSFLNNFVLCKLWELIEISTLHYLDYDGLTSKHSQWFDWDFFSRLSIICSLNQLLILLRPNKVFYSVISYHKINIFKSFFLSGKCA